MRYENKKYSHSSGVIKKRSLVGKPSSANKNYNYNKNTTDYEKAQSLIDKGISLSEVFERMGLDIRDIQKGGRLCR